jgi:hypothetical protein
LDVTPAVLDSGQIECGAAEQRHGFGFHFAEIARSQLAVSVVGLYGVAQSNVEDRAAFGPSNLQLVTPRGAGLRLFTVREVLTLPDPQWLIEGMVEVGAQGVIYGPSGHGKSFVALDWALCVATGKPWSGRPTKKGPAVYVVAEGGRGIKKRIAIVAVYRFSGSVWGNCSRNAR